MKKQWTLMIILLLTLFTSVPAFASAEGYCGFKVVGDAAILPSMP